MDTLGQNFFTEEYVSPRQQFMGYAAGTTAPGSRQRDALYRLQNPLLQQYYLGGLVNPAAGENPMFSGTGSFGGSFADFMGGQVVPRTPEQIASGVPISYQNQYTGQIGGERNLRNLAQTVSDITQLTEGEGPGGFTAFLENPNRGVTPQQAAIYRDIYQTGPSARENQLGLAQLLATSRPGGGIYGGIVGRALGQILQDLYTTYSTQNPEGNFLNYFLERTGAGPQANVGLASLMGA
tara:strand:+ start:3484 stop:4197 length:714 start_codon:yes stop_codon:yes gene_type:complete